MELRLEPPASSLHHSDQRSSYAALVISVGLTSSHSAVARPPRASDQSGAPAGKRRDAVRLGTKEGLQPRARQTARHQLR